MRLCMILHNFSKKIKICNYLKYINKRNLYCCNNKKFLLPVKSHNLCPLQAFSIENTVIEEDLFGPNNDFIENIKDDQIRTILFENSDSIINDLNKCASIEQVFTIFQNNKEIYNCDHLTQTVLVLYDLYKICLSLNGEEIAKLFLDNLQIESDFRNLLDLINEHLTEFSLRTLSYVYYYLKFLGVPSDDPVIENITIRIKNSLEENFVLEQCSQFLQVIFNDKDLRSIYLIQKILPKIYDEIGKCESVKDFDLLTVCLNKLNKIVTHDVLIRYVGKLQEFIDQKILLENDYKTILRIILLLNYPQWRNKHYSVITECILLMQNKIDSFTMNELIKLLQIVFKIQEPGELLNTIQRCSSKFLQSDEILTTSLDNKLKLFISLIYFSSTTNRIQYKSLIKNYVHEAKTISNLLNIRKILSYTKISDERLCSIYWQKLVTLLQNDLTLNSVLLLCDNYINFNIDIDNYRYKPFENIALNYLENYDRDLLTLFPSKFCSALGFVMLYGNNNLTSNLIDKLEEIYTQLSHVDCLKLSQCLIISNDLELNLENRERISKTLRKTTEHLIEFDINNVKFEHLIKANILRGEIDDCITDSLLLKYKFSEVVSSKTIENASFALRNTNSLIPEIINRLTDYAIKKQYNIIGFNAEKLLHLCYYLGYYPFDADKLFEILTDVIIRDQERLSGLSFLQSALSLCFYNRLPNSFVKLIFNVEFLNKLDMELQNCYSKDKYPQRVRKCLMELNRAVCLEYPECNVPWFHQKFAEESRKRAKKNIHRQHSFTSVRCNLQTTIQKPELLLENIITPYGYHIDFIVNLDKHQNIVPEDSPEVKTKLAIVLVDETAFTRFYIQLRGMYQMKKRHLEMFGYKVVIININDWMNLLYSKERIEFLYNLIWSQCR